ncbi:hypothetical protein FB451DRAFT_183039 [Mycena latifolia]|nr:hypothetical protein FB451DRAFT_183039 [Mycena latifolia]
MDQMEANARKKAGDLLNYIDLVYWERGKDPEPKCAAYMYYSTSCAALGNSWSSHCSEGGEKVFESSCRGLFKEGSLACGFLGCSSLCWKISTDGCDCDALKYTSEQDRVYQDPFFSRTTESTVGACRTKCGTQNGCVGFSVSPIDDHSLECRTYSSMTTPFGVDRAVSFRLIGPPVGSNSNPLCPRIPDGYSPISIAQLNQDAATGEQLANDYANSFARRELQSRAPDSFDPRPSQVTTRKNQAHVW